jgi:glycosyltransferase involved in cell wall biosynthesis
MSNQGKKVILAANTSWYIYNFRLPLIRALQHENFETLGVAPVDEYSSALRNAGCRIIEIKLNNKSINPLNEIVSVYDYYRIYASIKPDIILHFTTKPNIYGSMAARALKIPYVNNIAGLGTAFSKKGFLNQIVKSMYRLSQNAADQVFFQNRDDLDMFIKSRIVSSMQADLLPGSGIDLDSFAPASEIYNGSVDPGKQSTDLVRNIRFVLVARLIRDKGVLEFARAARIIKQKYPSTGFMLVGFLDKNNPGAIAETWIRRWENEGLLKWAGRQDDVRPFIAGADCVVLPSYYREGTPRSLLEGAAMGKPIIAADAVGTREPVENGVTGFLCRSRDPQDLARKMERIITMDPEHRLEMGRKGREKMVREFDVRIVLDKYVDIMREIKKI